MTRPNLDEKNLARACVALINQRSNWRAATSDRQRRWETVRFQAAQKRVCDAALRLIEETGDLPATYRSLVKLAQPGRGPDGLTVRDKQQAAEKREMARAKKIVKRMARGVRGDADLPGFGR